MGRRFKDRFTFGVKAWPQHRACGGSQGRGLGRGRPRSSRSAGLTAGLTPGGAAGPGAAADPERPLPPSPRYFSSTGPAQPCPAARGCSGRDPCPPRAPAPAGSSQLPSSPAAASGPRGSRPGPGAPRSAQPRRSRRRPRAGTHPLCTAAGRTWWRLCRRRRRERPRARLK